ncbi:pseudouridine synthase [Paenibacillus baekrokdamisoli]|uniref:Pseudouridine synthase n=2 Tax=Paenibacillus baekrokdamisoli TaxID=1712516 RepID=A0A3G9J6E8_9BACL|nr:pseudouridine synthase [Paenibacillus baekrokdamisoli]MBB3067476.1 16S rRNA pseudouridine516 synthase [Paenibacillus baekrokdamisoli]BBH19338.1 pseudouridine synthase [Paenibacillus baekrokdamisoli]
MAKRMRLDKLLANMGFGTRSEMRRAVKQGIVTVDDMTIKDFGFTLDPEVADVRYDGERVVYREVIYVMLHKPQGVVSATEDSRDRTVIDLLDPNDRVLQPFPVGRLDKDTEGLLLLTNDGKLAHDLLSPRKHVPKIYEADVLGDVGTDDIVAFAAGVALDDGYVTMPAQLIIDSQEMSDDGLMSHITLTIHEGKFHQVKRMFEAVGKKVVYLRRISMGPLQLDPELSLGDYRALTEAELESLLSVHDKEVSAD